MIKSIISNKPTRLFLILGGFFIANALIAEFIGVKIFSLESSLGLPQAEIPMFGSTFSFSLTAGVLLWPVVFIMTDVINEYYGRRGVKFLSWFAVILISYSFFLFYFAIRLTPAAWWVGSKSSIGVPDMQLAYSAVFGQGLWIIIGSIVAFLVGQVLDVFVFHKIKSVTGEKKIWLRATGSTLVSQLIDSFIVLTIAFYIGPLLDPSTGEPWPIKLLLTVGCGNYLYKFTVAVVLTPVIYLLHNMIEKYLGHDTAKKMKDEAMGRS